MEHACCIPTRDIDIGLICLSVRLSSGDIVSKRLSISSRFQSPCGKAVILALPRY